MVTLSFQTVTSLMLRSSLSTKRTRLRQVVSEGNLNWVKKIFKCPKSECGMVKDRDANGAKNIFLKNMQALGISVSPTLGPTPAVVGLLHGDRDVFA